MTFGKPFRAAPVKLGQFARAQEQRERVARVRRTRRLSMGVAAAVFVGGMTLLQPGLFKSALHSVTGGSGAPRTRGHLMSSTYYPSCAAARAAGAAPIHRGEPGYRAPLDADHDGVACEPYFGD